MNTDHPGAPGAAPSSGEPAALPPPRPRVRQRVKLADYRPVSAAPAAPVDTAHAEQGPPQAGARDYEVGYGKPPKHSQFKKGQSGNPKGRPKGAKSMNTIMREVMTQKLRVRGARGTKKVPAMEVLVQRTLEDALKGDARSRVELFRGYAEAIPEAHASEVHAEFTAEDLTAADLAALEALREELALPAAPMPLPATVHVPAQPPTHRGDGKDGDEPGAAAHEPQAAAVPSPAAEPVAEADLPSAHADVVAAAEDRPEDDPPRFHRSSKEAPWVGDWDRTL